MNRPSKKLIGFGILMLFANLADYVTTIYAIENGFKEANPYLDLAIQTNSFTFVKLVVPILIIIYLILRVKSKKSLERACRVMIFGSLVFTAVALHNLVRVLTY